MVNVYPHQDNGNRVSVVVNGGNRRSRARRARQAAEDYYGAAARLNVFYTAYSETEVNGFDTQTERVYEKV